MNHGWGTPGVKGVLRAYRVSDGHVLWEQETPKHANNAVAVGRLHGRERLSVVLPEGRQVFQGAYFDVEAFDAETGERQWVFHGPMQTGPGQAGDLEGERTRVRSGVRPTCLPNGWSAPTIDTEGDVIVGNQEGQIFTLRDADGNGEVIGAEEVRSDYDTGACYSGSSSAAIVDGMLAIASCDTLF